METVILSRALRNPTTATIFGRSLIATSVFIATFILFIYVRLMGLTIPSPASDEHLKALASQSGFSTNLMGFTGFMAYIGGMCLSSGNRDPKGSRKPTRWPGVARRLAPWTLGFVLLVTCSAFTGSRTPVLVCFLSGLVLLFANWVRSRSVVLRYQAYLGAAVIVIGAIFFMSTASFKRMSDVTNGRWDIWSVAVKKFRKSPLVGNGFQSVNDDLFALLPGVYKIHASANFPGGYHNQYLGTLAEEGIVGLVGVLTLYSFLLKSGWQLAFRRWGTWHQGQWALFGVLFLALRGLDEITGLFGYANGLGDLLAYMFVAIVVSRFSTEEDYARASRKQLRTTTIPRVSPLAPQIVVK
jgi:O-antigen ligase